MANRISMKFVSSLEKNFLDETLDGKKERNHFLMFGNEKLSFQLGVINEEQDFPPKKVPFYDLRLEGDLAPYTTVREVSNVPVSYPVHFNCKDEYYLRYTPGLYPDLLRPMLYRGQFRVPLHQLRSLWFDVSLPSGFKPGEYSLTATVLLEGEALESKSISIRVIDALLPPQKLIHTEWFYIDCLAEIYHTRVFSERHWKIIDSFMGTAARNGVNMLFTPVFTPELDTYIGGERLTTQLVDITVEGKNKYSFGFEKLGRWLELCRKHGIEYIEIPHFFTQWGAEHAPKFVAKVGGRRRRIFGWDTDSLGTEYRTFLACFIPALVKYLGENGYDRQHCYFHVSDEPELEHLEHYKACREAISPYLDGCPIIDALSDYAFYESGAISKPAPAIKNIKPFLEHNIKGMWAYYCGASGKWLSTDRYISMSSSRTRMLGVQLYRYNIEGFLHWGYNYYHGEFSYDIVNPFGNTDGECFAPSGDTFLVYPGDNGEAWESLRLTTMREAMDDIRALELCESLCGREAVEKLIHEGLDKELTFFEYPRDDDYLFSLRERVALAIEKALAK